jgi:hypothetical protein
MKPRYTHTAGVRKIIMPGFIFKNTKPLDNSLLKVGRMRVTDKHGNNNGNSETCQYNP